MTVIRPLFLMNLFLLVFTAFVSINAVTDFFSVNEAFSVEVSSDSIKEIRENLVEIRLSLQKGDLIEALQHLNNVDEQLLLLTTNNSNLLH